MTSASDVRREVVNTAKYGQVKNEFWFFLWFGGTRKKTKISRVVGDL